jgi:UDPglucose--hexose-1-phosphate uridylyltransferase
MNPPQNSSPAAVVNAVVNKAYNSPNLPIASTTNNSSPQPGEQNLIPIPQSHKDSEIRKHYFTNEHVIISPQKAKNLPSEPRAQQQNIDNNPPNQLDPNQKIIDSLNLNEQRQILAVENKYPSLQTSNNNAYGYQETIIDNTRLSKYFSDLSEADITSLIMMYKKRYRAIEAMQHIEYIQIFKNSGKQTGASLNYQHSQIIATNHIPNRINVLQIEANNFFNQKYENPISAIVSFEHNSSIRVIEENINWISFCPYFSIYPLEVWVLPKMPISNMGQIIESSINDLVSIMRKVITKLDKNSIDYNYYFLNAISNSMSMQLHITPRLVPNVMDGYEVANNEYINYIFPEDAAKWYNAVN